MVGEEVVDGEGVGGKVVGRRAGVGEKVVIEEVGVGILGGAVEGGDGLRTAVGVAVGASVGRGICSVNQQYKYHDNTTGSGRIGMSYGGHIFGKDGKAVGAKVIDGEGVGVKVAGGKVAGGKVAGGRVGVGEKFGGKMVVGEVGGRVLGGADGDRAAVGGPVGAGAPIIEQYNSHCQNCDAVRL